MAERICPKCGNQFPTSDGWPKAAVSLLIMAPAVPDVARQVRCPRCHHSFADGELRYVSASRFKVSLGFAAAVLIVVAVWALYRLFE